MKKRIAVVAGLITVTMLFGGCSGSEAVEGLIEQMNGGDTLFIKDGDNEYEISLKKADGEATATDGTATEGTTTVTSETSETPTTDKGEQQTQGTTTVPPETPLSPSTPAPAPVPATNKTVYSGYMIDVSACGHPYQNRFSYLVSNKNGSIFDALSSGTHNFYHAFYNPNSFPIKVGFSYQTALTDSKGNAFWGDCGSFGEPNVLIASGETKILTTAFTVEANNQVYVQGTEIPVSKLFTRISVSTADDNVPVSGTNVFVTDTKWNDIAALGVGIASKMELNAAIPDNGHKASNSSLTPVFELPEISASDKKTYAGSTFTADGGTKCNYQSDSKHIAKYFITGKGALDSLGYNSGAVNNYTFVFKNASDKTLEVFADFQGTVTANGKNLWAGPSSEQTDMYRFYSVPAGKTAVIKIPVYVNSAKCVSVLGQDVSLSEMFFRFDVRTPDGGTLPAGTMFAASVNGSRLNFDSASYTDAWIAVN